MRLRVLLAVLLLLLLLLATFAPAAVAALPPEASCDPDPDMYHHCQAGPVSVVVGPDCVVVDVTGPAGCGDART